MQFAKRMILAAVTVALASAGATAGEKTLMHCFAWTPVKEATKADWDAFYKASDAMPKNIKGVKHVWYGKLANPLGITSVGKLDEDTVKKYRAGDAVTGQITRTPREYGMCIEMESADVKKVYDTHPYHQTWTAAYEKVRVDGTTTFQILGQ